MSPERLQALAEGGLAVPSGPMTATDLYARSLPLTAAAIAAAQGS